MITSGMFSSNSNEWATPQDFFESLDAEFHFNLDPCCTHENAKCENHYTIEDDGLTKNWGGRECFATLRMVAKSRIGSRSATRNPGSRIRLSSCSSLPGRIQLTFTNTSTTRQGKFGSSGGVCISTNLRQVHHSRPWS